MDKFMKLLPINFTSKHMIQKPSDTLNNALEISSLPTTTYSQLSMYTTSKFDVPTTLHIIPNFILVWLDANIDVINDPDSRNTLTELRQVVNTVYTFVDVNRCMDFLMNIQNEKVFMIVSGSLGQHIISLLDNMCPLTSIYIFCGDKSKHEHWVKNWTKIKGVFTEISHICNELKQIAQGYDRDSISISIVSTNNEILTTELNQSFMYTQILKEILFDIDFDKKSIKDFTTYCRNQFANKEKELNIINEFERKYLKFKPIWWYTNECFLHRMLNQALRMMEVDIIIKMGFFVRDLHHQIEELHKKQFNDPDQKSFIVYRGQGLSEIDFNKIMETKGGLISFNNFLSSSKKQNIALLYARRTMNDSDLMGIVFKMTINPSISSTPFALLDDVSFFKGSEQEILFSMHTIFRIGNINQIDADNDRLWEIELTLTSSDSDQTLNELTQRIREETQGSKGWFRVGQLLIKLDQFDNAEEVYNVLLNQTTKKIEIGYIYHQLGWIKVNLGNYTEAISFFEKSLVIAAKILPSDHPDLATCSDNIGLVYEHMGEYIKALLSYQKALEIYRAILPSDHLDLATSLSNIGLIYNKLNDYPKALLFHKEALEIYRKKVPSNHSLLAVSYNNIGLVNHKMNDYSKALWFYDKTLEIYRNTLPPNHPDLAISHQNIGKALENMCEYSKALTSHKKALTIFQNTFPSDHPHLATCCSYIASVYNNMDQFSEALSFYEKTLDIYQKILPPYHPDFIPLYNSMGDIYDRMSKYSQATSFYQKASEVCQSTLATEHLLLASVYHKTAKVYYKMGCYSEALPYVEYAVNIGQRAPPLNYSDLQTYFETLELVKTNL